MKMLQTTDVSVVCNIFIVSVGDFLNETYNRRRLFSDVKLRHYFKQIFRSASDFFHINQTTLPPSRNLSETEVSVIWF